MTNPIEAFALALGEAANLSHGAQTGQPVTIGRAIFTADEIKPVLNLLKAWPAMAGELDSLIAEKEQRQRPVIVIGVEGGMVQGISGNAAAAGILAIIVDRDTDGADPSELHDIDGDESFVREETIAIEPESAFVIDAVAAAAKGESI